MPKLGLTSEPTASSQGGMMAAVIIAASTPPPGGGGGDTFINYYSNEFDGSNDYVDLGTELNSMFELGDSFSISVWIKFGNTSTERTIVANLNSSTKGFQLRLRPTEQIRWAFAQTPSVWLNVDSSVLAIDTWHHIVATYDGSNSTSGMNIYVNGSLDNNSTGGGGTVLDITVTESIKIGKYASGQFYAGNIDEVAIFDSELSASDVTAIYNSGAPDSLASQSNLKGWWRMGDGANYPIIKNQAHFSQTATYYDGGTNYVTDIDFSDFAGASNLSISVWAQYQGGNRLMLGTVGSLSHTVMINPWGSSLYWQIRNGGTTYSYFDFSGLMSVGDWFHLVCTFDGTQSSNADKMKMYFNGQQKTLSFVGTMPSTISSSIGNLELGRQSSYGTSNWFLGKLDDISIYNTTLTSSDATDIYNSGYPKDESERSGLVSYYKFDGDTYPVVQDALQFSNASLDFDGTDDYVDLNNGASVNPSSTVSLSCWVNFDAFSNYDGIFGKRMGTSVTMPFLLSLDNSSKIRFRIAQSDNTNKEIYTNSALSANTWYHVVAVADGTNIKLYIDGTLQTDTDTYDGTLKQSTADDVFIGRNASDYLNGKVSDAIIFSSALSASDVTNIYNSGKPKDESSTSNIVGYWRMGDNTISPNVPSALGYGTHSVEFDGVDDYIDCGQVSALAGASAFTISGWFNQPTIDQARYMFGTRVSTTNQITCETWSNGFLYLEIRNGGSTYAYFDYSTVVSAGEWFHFAMVFDGSGAANADRMKGYVNGSEVTLTYIGTIPATTNATQGDFWIGNVYGQTQRWEGPIKQMGIFDSALSASDITSIYNSGLPKDLSSESNLTNYWRMGDGEDKFPNILDYKGTNHGTMTNMASDDITTANVGSGTMTNMDSTDIVADSPAGTSGQMTNMDSGDFVAAKDAGTMVNMTAEDIVADVPS